MSKNDQITTESQHNSRPWGVFGAMLVGFLALGALTWFGAQRYVLSIAEINTVDIAQDWSRQVIADLGEKEAVFSTRTLKINDKYALKDYRKGTTIFRYRLVGDDGRVFWSSKYEEVGMVEKRPVFEQRVKRGITEIIPIKLKAAQIERVSTISQTHTGKHKGNMAALHDVAEVLVPVIKDNKFVGAMSLLIDNTDLYKRSEILASEISKFVISALALVFSIIAIMIWGYGSSRNKQNQSLHKEKLKAQGAEAEAREMAEKLQEMNDDIGELNNELNKNIQIIRDTQNEVIRKGKMAQLGQLTATVAHDIRNPLGSVRTSAFLLRRKFCDANPTMEKPLARIEKGVERCDGIITQLLDFARSKDIELTPHNLDKWLLDLLHEQAEILPQELSYECTLGLNDREVAFDADNLARAIINFLTNASEAMIGKGNDKPANPTVNPIIRISTAITDRGIEISVSDNGPGIKPDNLTKILDPLFTTKSFGVGLGLPAVEKIFEQHGGGMEVQSKEGNGATFTGWIAGGSSVATSSSNKAA